MQIRPDDFTDPSSAHLLTSWHQKAVAMFPELQSRFEEADSPYLLWFELRKAFETAYEQTPRDEPLISRIYQYADWSCEQPRGKTAKDDLLTCVAVCFFEHIPEHPEARADMPRWFKYQELLVMEQVFRYQLSATEYQDFMRYCEQNQGMYVEKPNRKAAKV